MQGHRAKSSFFIEVEVSEVGPAQLFGVRQQGFEYRLQLAGRTRDNAKHLGRRRLLVQCLAQIVGALSQLVEEPRVLDRDDRLMSEVCDQRNLLVGEGPHFLAVDTDSPD